MTSIFEGQPPETRPFPIKARVMWVLGVYIYIYMYIYIYTHYISPKKMVKLQQMEKKKSSHSQLFFLVLEFCGGSR